MENEHHTGAQPAASDAESIMAEPRAEGYVPAQSIEPQKRKPLWSVLGPGLITGAADDDPSGIGTYSVAGAQYGYGLLWLVPLSIPLMIAV